jgi:hypothetical protein
MRVLRILRGVVGTAVVFVLPWAISGALLAVAVEWVWPNAPVIARGPVHLLQHARDGAKLFGVLGAVVGATFATALAATGRRLRFEQLTSGHVLALGIAGAVGVTGAGLGLDGVLRGAWPVQYTIALGISAVLGGGSAVSMLHIARLGKAQTQPQELNGGINETINVRKEQERLTRHTT